MTPNPLMSWLKRRPKEEVESFVRSERELQESLKNLKEKVAQREQMSEKLSCEYNKQIEEASSVMRVIKGFIEMVDLDEKLGDQEDQEKR